MKSFVEEIDEESEKAFEALALSKIQFLYSPAVNINYDSSILTVHSISIPIGPKKFIIIENDWSDTPEEAIDYYFLKARISEKPKDIKVEEYREGKSWSYFLDHLSFHVGRQEKVSKVIILEYELEIGAEMVRYDAGFLIELESGKQISVVREQSITGFLEIAYVKEEVENSISELKQRIVYNTYQTL